MLVATTIYIYATTTTMATKEDEKRFDPGFSNRSISVQDIYCSYPLIKDRQKIVVATTIYATTTMDNRSLQPKKMRNWFDPRFFESIDLRFLKDLLFPLIKANGYCHNYIRNNGRNNNGQQKFATEEDEKRFDPLSTVSSNSPFFFFFSYLSTIYLLFYIHKGTDCSRALLPRERFLSYRSIVRGPGRAYILISLPTKYKFF